MESILWQREQVREKVFFGFDWQFALTDDLAQPNETASWRGVQLPHDWSVDYPVAQDAPSSGSGGYARTGIGWYRRAWSMDKLPGERYSLAFDGVYMNCDVWVNGQLVGGHIYGYTGFELDVTDQVRSGENTVLMRVDNSHQPGSRWYTGSGITRNVYLARHQAQFLRTGGIYITTPRIADDEAKVSVRTDAVGGLEGQEIRLSTSVIDAEGRLCVKEERALPAKAAISAHQTLTVANPRRWDIEHPYLYKVVSRLTVDGQVTDEVTTFFGIRAIAYDAENGFMLNGRKVIMQGVCLHHDGGCVGAAVPPEVWRRRLLKLKEMGVNALRCSHNPPDPALLDLADEMGFCVMDEAFDEWRTMKGKEFGSNTHESRGYSEWFDTCAREDMTAMVERDRNHPSIVMWSIGNEVREQSVEGEWEIARMLAGLCHSLDPSRPITQACDQVKAEPVPAYTQFLQELDIVGVNYTDRWHERTETFFEEEKREHPDWLLLGSEDVSVGGRRGDYDLSRPASVWGMTTYHTRMLKAEKLWKFIRTRPYVIGSFMWTGVDYLGECFWPDKGSSAGVLDTCGYAKDGFAFYQSQWVKDRPVLYLCPHLNLGLAPGTVYPLVCYTNCFSVELLVDGRSWGVKAYEFPNQGMTQEWAHFDRPFAPITTNDLHLSWDIPYGGQEIVAIGRNNQGEEIARVTLTKAGLPSALRVTADQAALPADGRSVVQLDVAVVDDQGRVVPDHDLPISVRVEGGELLGMDNGRTNDQTLYKSETRESYRGLAYAIIRAPREKGTLRVTVSAPEMAPVTVELPVG